MLLAMCMCYTGFEMTERTMASRGGSRGFWRICGGAAMGIGLWAALYVATLAFRLPVPIFYHYPTLGLGLLSAIFSTTVGLFSATGERKGIAQPMVASLAVGGSLAALPFLGIAGMRTQARMEYRWGLAAVSSFLGMVIFLLILLLVLRFLRNRRPRVPEKVISAVIVGSAIALLPYLSLLAVRFHSSAVPADLGHTVGRSSLSIGVTGGAAFLILLGTVIASALEGLLESQEAVVEKAQESEVFFRSLSEAIPGIIWTACADGSIDFASDRWYSYSGQLPQSNKDLAWKQALHPDDVAVTVAKWAECVRTGEAYEMEYRLRRGSDASYRWFLARATPVHDDQGQIIKWFGTVTDIEDQKQSQQILEELIKERTEQLAEANTRLQEEMWERDLARKELDQQNERMLRELSERSQRATLLTKMGEHLQSCLTRDEVFAAALGFAPKIFLHRGAIALLNPERNLAEVIGSWANCELPRKAFEPNACWALRTGHQHLVVEGDTTARCSHAADVKHTYLCIPILAQGETLGIMHFQATEESPSLTEAELSFKTTFAGQVGLSIANINLRDALRTQSIKDTLTGLYNRRYLEEMLEREIRRAARAEQALGILMIDLDHFKSFNDTYGHDAGDAVLRETASFVARSVRAEDTVCRFGGEEFVVILPTADLEGAQNRAEAIRSKLKDLRVQHQGQSLGMITASIGVSAFPVNGTSSGELFAAADAALYRAKREGRDRVAVAPPQPQFTSAVGDTAKS
jgi:diguanylate cyclase (GGDEF)-like protein/PAS domain S-box-containing protein